MTGGEGETTWKRKRMNSMTDNQKPDFQILPTLGIKCYLYDGGSVILEQHDPYAEETPMIEIPAHYLDTVIVWLTQAKKME